MKLDWRNLKPGRLAGLLNSTRLGEVATETRVRRNVVRAGLRVGDGTRVNFLGYVAWLLTAWDDLRDRPERPDGYEGLKDAARQRNARLSAAGRDIAPLPEVVDPRRKDAAASSFRRFCEAYFPETFHLPWSDDHLKVIAKIEQAVLAGGLFAMAMPRGSGKTTLAECACLWAILFGHREFVCLIGSDEGHAVEMLESIKTELSANDRLLEDFPEACWPIHRLEGIANRAAGQLCDGERTHIGWTAKEVVLPTIPGSKASGAIIRVAGLTGRIRGMKFKRPDGKTVRPSLVVLDDPQTDESARSLSQCAARESILAGAVLGLAGPGRKISGIMPCTVIRPGDMADRILDRDKHPQWQGERTRMVYRFPDDESLWAKYAELRAEGLRTDRGIAAATEFYRENRQRMDAGAAVAWPARHNEDELSAVQHAMNLKYQDEAAFWAEYQNEPLPEDTGDDEMLTADEIAAKTNGHRRREVPIDAAHVTCFIDVQGKALFYLVAAWAENFTGYVVDYGTWPDQRRAYFTLRDMRRTLARAKPGACPEGTRRAGLEGQIYHALETLTGELLGRPWRRDDGAELPIARCLIDANWGQSTDVVYQFCRQSAHAAVVTPSHGKYVGASSKPFDEYKRRPGERVGHHWRVPNVQGKRQVRHVLIDTNYWKTFVHARLAVAMGDPGCLSLYGSTSLTAGGKTGSTPLTAGGKAGSTALTAGGRDASNHRLLADHLTAEYRVKTEARGRTVDEWKLRAGRPDNHWLDCLVGAAAAASMCGASLPGMAAAPPDRRRKRYTQQDLRRRR